MAKTSPQSIIKTYYQLTKPGIIYGNALAAIAGFFLATKHDFNLTLFLGMLFGTSFIIASACVFNNYIDRNIDAKMARTKKRALVQGVVSGRNALIYATTLGIVGFLLLFIFTNLLTVAVGCIGIFFYVVLYGIWKRRSPLGTLIGSIPGAIPPVAGYLAVTNHLDTGALLLFLVLAFWQMPHFYAIGIYRLKDYAEAGLPILPVKNGIQITKIHILLYMLGFAITAILLSLLHYTGIVYLIGMVVICSMWIFLALQGFRTTDTNRWARKVFFFSLITLLMMCLLLSFNSILP